MHKFTESAANDSPLSPLISCPPSTKISRRRAARAGRLQGHTSGLAPAYVQANLAILPAAYAADFRRYCELNVKACPLLAVTAPGETAIPALGADLDLRTDVPRYRIWRDGQMVEEPTDIRTCWRDDLVTFAIGCSFSFEQALLRDGLVLRHIEQNLNVAMYRSSIPTQPAGPFGGPMVVSMRPLRADAAIRAIQITSRFPRVHGAPVHFGDPKLIGIDSLASPDYGDPIEVRPDEIPVFWACGVTPQAAIAQARPSLCITHAPGAMLVTDLMNDQLAAA